MANNKDTSLKFLENQQSLSQETTLNSKNNSNVGLLVAGGIGIAGFLITALSTPFVLPALRKHCLPYVPATDIQLQNLSKAFRKHATKGDRFLDIGSGDGRICRLAANYKVFSQVHGVELNYLLVLYSRLMAFRSQSNGQMKFFHKNLWNFPLKNYDAICIFGVESIMDPLADYIKSTNERDQTIYACRFQFPTRNLNQIDQIGSGIDTVWVYRMKKNTS